MAGLCWSRYLTGKVADSPRTEMMLSNQVAKGVVKTAALIVGNYKLILGVQLYGFWQVSCSSQNQFPVACEVYSNLRGHGSLAWSHSIPFHD